VGARAAIPKVYPKYVEYVVSRGDVVRCRNVLFVRVGFCIASHARRTCIKFAVLLESSSVKTAARITCGIFGKEAASWIAVACSTFLLIGGLTQSFPPIFFFWREAKFFEARGRTKKQTDREQHKALF